MTDEDVLKLASSLGLGRAVETDPASVIAAAQRARSGAEKIKLETGQFGEPWPPMKVME